MSEAIDFGKNLVLTGNYSVGIEKFGLIFLHIHGSPSAERISTWIVSEGRGAAGTGSGRR